MPVSYPKTWVSGEELVAADLNANFTAVKTAYDQFELVGWSIRNLVTITASQTLTADDCNKMWIANTSGLTITLPNAEGLPNRRTFFIMTNFASGSITITSTGSYFRHIGAYHTQIVLAQYTGILLMAVKDRNEYFAF